MSMKESNRLMKELSDKLKAIYDVAKQHEDGFCVLCNTDIHPTEDCECGKSWAGEYDNNTEGNALVKIKEILGI